MKLDLKKRSPSSWSEPASPEPGPAVAPVRTNPFAKLDLHSLGMRLRRDWELACLGAVVLLLLLLAVLWLAGIGQFKAEKAIVKPMPPRKSWLNLDTAFAFRDTALPPRPSGPSIVTLILKPIDRPNLGDGGGPAPGQAGEDRGPKPPILPIPPKPPPPPRTYSLTFIGTIKSVLGHELAMVRDDTAKKTVCVRPGATINAIRILAVSPQELRVKDGRGAEISMPPNQTVKLLLEGTDP